ncbi:MAG: CotH kinase family protein, partial [Firmicutes bacterium]|nr:CotH kinase family protein [Bacillota bacterium]
GMVHNYYLYEKDGKMSMIPWDYNLAFGGFGGSKDAGSLVNFSMDEPVSSGSVEDRPMLSWIFADEKYTEQYHQEIENFLKECYDSGYIKEEIASVKAMISPYVKDDPTKFCTYDEFEKGIDTLDKFCDLRCKSIKAQLKGDTGSVDASGINISDMGGMGGMGAKGAKDARK